MPDHVNEGENCWHFGACYAWLLCYFDIIVMTSCFDILYIYCKICIKYHTVAFYVGINNVKMWQEEQMEVVLLGEMGKS